MGGCGGSDSDSIGDGLINSTVNEGKESVNVISSSSAACASRLEFDQWERRLWYVQECWNLIPALDRWPGDGLM